MSNHLGSLTCLVILYKSFDIFSYLWPIVSSAPKFSCFCHPAVPWLSGVVIRKMSEHGPQWSWMLLVHQEGLWSRWSTWSTLIHSAPHFLKFYRKCGPGRIRVDQEDQGDHNSPLWTRTGFYILPMVVFGDKSCSYPFVVWYPNFSLIP